MPIEEKLSLRRGKYFQVECDFISRLSVIFLGDSLCMCIILKRDHGLANTLMDISASCLGLESKFLDIVSIVTSLVVSVILE